MTSQQVEERPAEEAEKAPEQAGECPAKAAGEPCAGAPESDAKPEGQESVREGGDQPPDEKPADSEQPAA